MGEKFNKLYKEAIESGRILPYYPFTASTDSLANVSIGRRYAITFHYHYLARLLPEFIEHYTLQRLRSSKRYKNASTGKKITLIHQQKSIAEIFTELLDAIDNCDKAIIKRYFSPKIITVSVPAKEQFDDFMSKYYQMKTTIIHLNSNPKFQKKKSNSDIDQRMLLEAKKIFKYSKYDQRLFYEYFNAMPSFTDTYIATGLEIYREKHLNFNPQGINQYTKAVAILHSKPKNIGYQKTIRGLNLYREYYKHISEFRSRKKYKIKDPKITAIKRLLTKGRLTPKNWKDMVPSIYEVVKVYTAFFHFAEQSDLGPYNTQEYLDYLHNRFPEI